MIPLLAAGSSVPPLVFDLGICLVAATLGAVLSRRLAIPHVVGFVAAGIVIGPTGLGLVQEPRDIQVLADLGIILLLFLLGAELDFAGLARRGRALLVAGLLQVPLTVVVAMLAWTGWTTAMGSAPSTAELVYLSLACAFSSTLLVVKALESSRIMMTALGTLCIGLLLAQDLWALIILSIQPATSLGPAAIAAPILGTLLLAVTAWFIGRPLVARVIAVVGDDAELLGLSALGWCLGWSLLAGGLEGLATDLSSPVIVESGAGMGAFIGGATLAAVPRARDLVHRLVSLRDIFIVCFFVSLGMSLPWPPSAGVLLAAGALLVILALTRVVVMHPLLRLGGEPGPMARQVTIRMTQVSEFGLVILYIGQELGHIGPEPVAAVLLAFVASSVATPLLLALVDRTSRTTAPEPHEDPWSNPEPRPKPLTPTRPA